MERGGNLENTEASKNKDDIKNEFLPTAELTVRRMSQSETWERLKLRRISSSNGGTTSRFDDIIDDQKKCKEKLLKLMAEVQQ